MGFMTGLATGFFNSKAENMKTDRATKVKLATQMAAESRQATLKLRTQAAGRAAELREARDYTMKTFGVNASEADQMNAITDKKRLGKVQDNARKRMAQRAQKGVQPADDTAPVQGAADTGASVQREIRNSMTDKAIDLFQRAAHEEFAVGWNFAKAHKALSDSILRSFGATFEGGKWTGKMTGGVSDKETLRVLCSELGPLMNELVARLETGEHGAAIMADLTNRALNMRVMHEQKTKKVTHNAGDVEAFRKSVQTIKAGDTIVDKNGIKHIVKEEEVAMYKKKYGR